MKRTSTLQLFAQRKDPLTEVIAKRLAQLDNETEAKVEEINEKLRKIRNEPAEEQGTPDPNVSEFDTKYIQYLDELRESGVTNMFGAGQYLEEAFGIDKPTAHAILLRWMKEFGDRSATDPGKIELS